jgi:hypothetical protein
MQHKLQAAVVTLLLPADTQLGTARHITAAILHEQRPACPAKRFARHAPQV